MVSQDLKDEKALTLGKLQGKKIRRGKYISREAAIRKGLNIWKAF